MSITTAEISPLFPRFAATPTIINSVTGRTLDSDPVTISIPTPGVGKILVPKIAILKSIAGTLIPWSGGQMYISSQPGVPATGTAILICNDPNNPGAPGSEKITDFVPAVFFIGIGAAYEKNAQLYISSDNSSSGFDGSFEVYLEYAIIDLN